MVIAEAGAKAFNQACDGIDGEGRIGEPRRSGGQVDGGQFVQTHRVIDHDYLGRDFADLGPNVIEGPERVVGRGEVLHGRYATGAKWGETPT